MSPSPVTWSTVAELKSPFLIMGFHGWSNAGNVSSDTLTYLGEVLQPRVVATICEESFVDYTVNRPIAQIENGIIYELEPMLAEVTCWINPSGNHDLVLILGKEPHLAWRQYAEMILDIVRRLNVERLYTIGGVQDTVSHAGPALVTVVGSSPSVVGDTMKLDRDIKAADYYGPVSIHSSLIKACMDAGVQAASLWGHVPAYLQKSPRIVAKLVTILSEAAEMSCSVEPLKQKSLELDRKINEALSKDPDLKQFVESIRKKENVRSLSSTDDKIIHINDFIRKDPRKDPEP
ncbi:MAG TPA: PAC2 family protein [Desulfomonilaceae bacterium]|nr:PAC2 family protein [Desulfomonilaceae bacterium]